jgi:hypothetical protein
MVRKAGADWRNRHPNCGCTLMETDSEDEEAPIDSAQELRAAAAHDFERLVNAVADAPDDLQDTKWEVVDDIVINLVSYILHAIIGGIEGPRSERLQVPAAFDDARSSMNLRRKRALEAIETALKIDAKAWKSFHTVSQRTVTVLKMFEEQDRKGVTREVALKNIGKTENSIKQYVGPVKAMLLGGELGTPPPRLVKVVTTPSKAKPRAPRRRR